MHGKKLYLVDGHSLTFKAYYAIRDLTNSRGEPTNAVLGFLRMLLAFCDKWKPEYLAVAFDTGKPTFRGEMYAAYKAHREAPPADFDQQMRWIYELLRQMGIAIFEKDGFEADDLIGTMTHAMAAAGGKATFLSADKDLMQLVDENVTMLRPAQLAGQEPVAYDIAGVEQKMGVPPRLIADWLALVGDTSDNIPGVPGIGAKTASKLLADYGSLDALLARAHEISRPRWREALVEHADQARLARALATVRRDVDFPWSLEQCRFPAEPWTPAAVELMSYLGFERMLRDRGQTPAAVPPPELRGDQPAVTADYRVLCDADALRQWVEGSMKAPWLALDTETTSTDAMRAELVGISLSHSPGAAVYLPIGHQPHIAGSPQLSLDETRVILAPLLAGQGPRLTAHHAKFDWKVLVQHGFQPIPPAFDTMIACYLLDPDRAQGHGLKSLAHDFCGLQMRPIAELIGRGRDQLTMAELAVSDVADYAALDADATLRLTECLSEKLAAEPALKRVFDEIEMPLLPVLLEMEMGGFAVDPQVLHRLGEKLRARLTELCEEIWQVAGHRFNIGSPRQVAEVLYGELDLPKGRKGKTGYSTNEAELERLAPLHPIPNLILEYRANEKLQSTYIDSLPRLVNPKTRRLHTSFNQTMAATGRLSSTDPNLQNIPIRSEMGREIRRAFIADHPGYVLIKADYSQIELRILAHVSGDPALAKAYREGSDVHRQTASQVFGVDPADVTREMRAQAKTINFGIIYGISAHGLARQLGIGRNEAARFIERYFDTYPGVRAWIDSMLERARQTGYVETLMGRRRAVPRLHERNAMARANEERIAVNSPIQGASADMIKLAMLRIAAGLSVAAPGARMVCQVHDELVFSAPPDRLEAASRFIRESMEQALPLNVPVVVDISHAPNWADC